MAVTRRGYIFGAFLLSVLCVLLIVVAVSSDSWIVSTATPSQDLLSQVSNFRYGLFRGEILLYSLATPTSHTMYMVCLPDVSACAVSCKTEAIAREEEIVSTATPSQDLLSQVSNFRYGLFRGEILLYSLATPTSHTMYMVCLPDVSACAVSCKTEPIAREEEVRAMAQGYMPNLGCLAFTEVSTANPLDRPPVISFAVYVCVLLFLFLQLATAVVAAGLSIINATMNPTEPMFGLPGCLWSNAVAALLGLTVMMLFGIYWATSGLGEHLAFAHIAFDFFKPGPYLGYSYWLLLGAVLCSLSNIGLIQLRTYLLERDPPPPTIKVENHSDGTIFLY